MSLAKCCLVTLSAGALALLVPGCGLLPCVDGTIQIEVLELQPGGTCLWELWPAGATIDAKTTGSRGNSGNRCVIQNLEYLDPPTDELPSGELVVPSKGYEIAFLPGLQFDFEGCSIVVNGILTVDEQYDDFEAALAEQDAGAEDVFFVEMGYVTVDECSQYPFEQETYAPTCSNTYRARVTKL